MSLRLDKHNKVLAGVCAGLANEIGMSPIAMRLIFVLAFLFFGIGPILYLILWLILELSEKS